MDPTCCLSSSSIDRQGHGFCRCLASPVSGDSLSSAVCGLSPLLSPFSSSLRDYGFYLISFHSHYFARHLGRETEKAWGQSSIFFPPAGYDNSRRTTTGLSCFLPALNTRNLTSDFRKGAWKLFWKFYLSTPRSSGSRALLGFLHWLLVARCLLLPIGSDSRPFKTSPSTKVGKHLEWIFRPPAGGLAR